MKLNRWTTALLIVSLLILGFIMISYPNESWLAGTRGLAIWWNVLFPSLFPFFVISELMLGFGIVHFLGTMLDPMMKPLFRIPGSGGFVAAMGFASGYPVSAKLATKIRQQGLISRIEGERLVSFTTTSDPIFLIGAVSVGFFGNPKLAVLLAVAHYGSAIILGLGMRFYGRNTPTLHVSSIRKQAHSSDKFSIKTAIRAMHRARMMDGRTVGEMLQQAISSSLQLMAVVGGLVVFFSVILEVLIISNGMTIITAWISHILPFFGLPPGLAEALVGGIFEVTLGAKASATPVGIPIVYKAAAAAFILSWGGLSVHAQVASILNEADLRYAPFLFARIIHAILSAILVIVLWNPLGGAHSAFMPAMLQHIRQTSVFTIFPQLLALFLGLLISIIIVSILITAFKRWIFKKGQQIGK